MKTTRSFFVLALFSGVSISSDLQAVELTFKDSITNSLGESVVFDRFTNTAFGNSANGVQYSTIGSNLQFGTLGTIDFSTYVPSNDPTFTFGGVSSVDIDPLNRGFGVATVINATGAGSNAGAAVFFNTNTKAIIGHQLVGFHPDMVTFNSTGTNILVANESDNAATNGNANPGSVSNINVSSVTGALNFGSITHTNVDFTGAGVAAMLVGVRDPGATMNTNLTAPNLNHIEPEYISVSGDKAYVTLQEGNAVGVLDIPTNTWTAIHKLGVNVQTMDAKNNSTISVTDSIATLAMPDSISTFVLGTNTYFATANEGDYRDSNSDRRGGSAFVVGGGIGQIDTVLDATLDGLYGGNWQNTAANGGLGGTRFLSNVGDLNNDGDIDQLTIAGSRSMSIYDATTGLMLFDTNDIAGFDGFEAWIAANDIGAFNNDQAGVAIDVRSRDKGPEPEALAIGEFNGDLYALVGMERTNHLFLFLLAEDYLSATSFNASNVQFVDAIRVNGEFGVETIEYVSAAASPDGNPFFIAGSEISNTWAIYSIPEPSTSFLVLGATMLFIGSRRRA